MTSKCVADVKGYPHGDELEFVPNGRIAIDFNEIFFAQFGTTANFVAGVNGALGSTPASSAG